MTDCEDWRLIFGREFSWLGPLFLASALTLRTRESRTVWTFCAASFLVTMCAYSATVSVVRFYRPFAPVFLLCVCVAGAELMDRLPGKLRTLGPLAALAISVWFATPLAPLITKHTAKHADMADACAAIDELLPRSAVLASPVSYKVAWDCDRPAVRFYARWNELHEMDRRFVGIDGVYFHRRHTSSWVKFGKKNPLSEIFPARHNLPGDAQLWLRKE